MERNKLITLRIDKDNLTRIEDLIKGAPYLNRSRIINVLLSAMLFCCDGNGLFQTLDCYDPVSDGLKIHVYKILKPNH